MRLLFNWTIKYKVKNTSTYPCKCVIFLQYSCSTPTTPENILCFCAHVIMTKGDVLVSACSLWIKLVSVICQMKDDGWWECTVGLRVCSSGCDNIISVVSNYHQSCSSLKLTKARTAARIPHSFNAFTLMQFFVLLSMANVLIKTFTVFPGKRCTSELT